MVNSILSAGGSPHNALLSHPDPLLEPHPFSGRSHGEFGFRVCEHGPQRDGERDKRFVEIRGVLHLSSYSLAFEAIANERHWMDHQSDRLPRQTRCKGMRIKREIQMGASGGGQSIKASGIAARTGRTQTCNRHDSPKPKTPLTRGGRPHNLPAAASHANSRIGMLTDLKARPRDNRGQRLIAAPRQIQILNPPCATVTPRQSCQCRDAGFPS